MYPNALGILRRNPGVMVGLTASVVGTIAVLGVVARLPTIGIEKWTPAADGDAREVLVVLGLWPVGAVLVALVWLVASVFLTGIGSVVVQRSLIAARTPLTQAWRIARPRMAAAIALGVLDLVVILVPLIMAAMASIASATFTGPSIARAVSIGFFALAALVILAVLPTLVLAGPALIVERRRPFDALWRGVELQRGTYWHLLPRVLTTYFVVWAAATMVGLPFSLAALGARTSDLVAQSTASLLLATTGWVVGQVVVLPFLIAVNALMYLEQRKRSESGLTVAVK